jgi:transposase InsO family protein
MRLNGSCPYYDPTFSGSAPRSGRWRYLLRNRAAEEPDEVWCADITYIPVPKVFAYLVAIMDWQSHSLPITSVHCSKGRLVVRLLQPIEAADAPSEAPR